MTSLFSLFRSLSLSFCHGLRPLFSSRLVSPLAGHDSFLRAPFLGKRDSASNESRRGGIGVASRRESERGGRREN